MTPKLKLVDVPLEHLIVDHLCYRTETPEDYKQHQAAFMEMSAAYTKGEHNGREFHQFWLKEPVRYEWGGQVHTVEFPSPGGSANYETGIQHIEVLATEPLFLLMNNAIVDEFRFTSKSGDETYLSWSNKSAFKITEKPLFMKSIVDDKHELTYLT